MREQQLSIRHSIGHFLILSAILGLILIYAPIVNLNFTNKPLQTTFSNQDFIITIPKIQAQSKIFTNVDPFNESEYRPVLEKGIAQAKNTSLPNQIGTIFLFAHSSQTPWQMTRANTAFLKLDQLTQNDQILINYQGQKYLYAVTAKKEVWPNEVEYLTNTQKTQLILQTCTPIGTSLKRLLIFADPVIVDR